MSRLTTDKPVSEMGMYEMARNCCYIGEDGTARYRDFDKDIDARDFVRKLMVEYGLWKEGRDDELFDDDCFDNEMMDNLMFSPTTQTGLIALFYCNLWAMAELRERLKHYEDLAEQGKLLELPVSVGTKLYHVIEDRIAEPPIYISEHEIKDVSARAVYFADDWWTFEEMRECKAFLDKEEAENALKEMRAKT